LLRLDAHLDGHVRIWSTEAIASSGNPDYNKPRQLAAMSHHSGTIHSVRFSGNGKYLASGADDKIVCVYNLDPTPPAHTTFGTSLLLPGGMSWLTRRGEEQARARG